MQSKLLVVCVAANSSHYKVGCIVGVTVNLRVNQMVATTNGLPKEDLRAFKKG